MPRQPNGNYTLPLPPVVSGDVVESAWANTTLNDIALAVQDSLSRTGQGAMSNPILLVDGTKAAPGVAFNNESNTGMYRPSTGDLYFATLGKDYLRLSDDNGVQFTLDGTTWTDVTGAVWESGPLEFVDGTEALPAITFASDTDTGIYRGGVNDMRFTAGGADQFRITTSGAEFTSDGGSTWNPPTTAIWETSPLLFINGSSAAPSISFQNDTNAGMYLAADGDVRFAINGVDKMRIDLNGPQVKRNNNWQLVAAYDEGEWTPQVEGFTMLSQNHGSWSRVGNQVTLFGDVRWNTRTGSSSDPILVSGLPFEIRESPAGSARMYVPTFMAWADVNLSGRTPNGGPELFTRTMIKDPAGAPKTLKFAVYIGNNSVWADPVTTSGGQAVAYQSQAASTPDPDADTIVYPTLAELLPSGALSFTLTYLTDDPFPA